MLYSFPTVTPRSIILCLSRMSELPSIYSSKGLSSDDRKKVLTVGTPREARPVGALKIETKVSQILDNNLSKESSERLDNDGDIPMYDLDDDDEVQLITDYVLERRQHEPLSLLTKLSGKSSMDDSRTEPKTQRRSFLVVDTNFILSHLRILDQLSRLSVEFHHQIIIPITVMKELDGLKNSTKKAEVEELIDNTTIGYLARWANDWIYKNLAESSTALRGQKYKEVIDRNATKDDAILDCCIYFKDTYQDSLIILLSNDKNLCLKALANEILTVSYRKGMSAQLIAEKTNRELHRTKGITGADIIVNNQTAPVHDDVTSGDDNNNDLMQIDDNFTRTNIANSFEDDTRTVYNEITKITLEAIDKCMVTEYEDDVELIGYDSSSSLTLRDCSNVMIRYWVSVFTEYFSGQGFKPFNTKGPKTVSYVQIPEGSHEFVEFVEYWTQVLKALYMKRSRQQNFSLSKLIERWKGIAAQPLHNPGR